MTQRDDDMRAARDVLNEPCGSLDCAWCETCQLHVAEALATVRAAARKEALEADPVRRLMRHPKLRRITVYASGRGVRAFMSGGRSFFGKTPEAACEAALKAMEGVNADR